MGKQFVTALLISSIGISPLMVYAENKPQNDEQMVAIGCQGEGQAIDLQTDPTVLAESELYRKVSAGVMVPGALATVYFLLIKSADQRLLFENQQSRQFLREFLRLREALAAAKAEFSAITRSTHDFVVQHKLGDLIQEMKAKGINNPNYFLEKANVPEAERIRFNKLAIDRINNGVEQQRLQREIRGLTEVLRRRDLVQLVRFGKINAEGHVASLEKRAGPIMERIERARPRRAIGGLVGLTLWVGGAAVFTAADHLAVRSDVAEEAVLATTLECLARHQEQHEAPISADEQLDYNSLRQLQDPSNLFPFFKQKE